MKILFKNKWLLNNFNIENKIVNAIINDKIILNDIPTLLLSNNINFINYIYKLF